MKDKSKPTKKASVSSYPNTSEKLAISQTQQAPPFRKRNAYIVIAVYAIIMLIISLGLRKIGLYDIETDFYQDYVIQAQKILKGQIPVEPFHGPGYPFVLAAVNVIFNELFTSARIISALSAALYLLLAFLVIREKFDSIVATLTAFSMAINPTLFRYSYIASSDMIFSFIATLAVFLSIRALEKGRFIESFLVGILSGTTFLIRYNGIFLFFAYAVASIYSSGLEIKKLFSKLGGFVFGCLLILIPWGLYTKYQTGIFLYNQNFYNIAWEVYGKDNMSWDEFWHNRKSEFSSFMDVVMKDPWLFLEKIGGNLIVNIWNDLTKLVGWFYLPFFVIGLIYMVKKKQWPKITLLLPFYAFFYLILSLVFYSERFSFFMLPFYLLICWTSVLWLPEKWKWVSFIIALILNIPNLVMSIKNLSKDISQEPRDVLYIAREFISRYGPPRNKEGIMARKAHIAYYLGMDFHIIPIHADTANLPLEMKKVGAKYLYYSSIEYYLRPNLRSLANYQNPPDYLEPILVNYRPFAVLYKLRDR